MSVKLPMRAYICKILRVSMRHRGSDTLTARHHHRVRVPKNFLIRFPIPGVCARSSYCDSGVHIRNVCEKDEMCQREGGREREFHNYLQYAWIEHIQQWFFTSFKLHVRCAWCAFELHACKVHTAQCKLHIFHIATARDRSQCNSTLHTVPHIKHINFNHIRNGVRYSHTIQLSW